jgi:Mg2+ and Co2+ transporter CorA
MVSILQYFNNEIRKLTLKELAQCLQRQEGIFWVDLEDPNEAEEETVLVSLFDIHPLAIEDSRSGRSEEGHLPKVEDFGDYLFIIFNPIEHGTGESDRRSNYKLQIKTSQLSAFLSKRALITHHYKPLRSISYAFQVCAKNMQILGRGPDYLFNDGEDPQSEEGYRDNAPDRLLSAGDAQPAVAGRVCPHHYR